MLLQAATRRKMAGVRFTLAAALKWILATLVVLVVVLLVLEHAWSNSMSMQEAQCDLAPVASPFSPLSPLLLGLRASPAATPGKARHA